MARPEISIAPGLGPKSNVQVFVNGIALRGVKAVVAHPGADVLLVIERENVGIEGNLAASGTTAAPVRAEAE